MFPQYELWASLCKMQGEREYRVTQYLGCSQTDWKSCIPVPPQPTVLAKLAKRLKLEH